MVEKIVGIFFKAIAFVLAFWLLSYLIISSFVDFFVDYDIFNTDDTPAIVTEKFSKNSLTGRPTYFVITDLNEVEVHNGIENKVFASQFKQLEVGYEVEGHHIHGNHFFTTLDIVTDSFVFIFMMIFLLFLFAMLLCWPLFKFIEKREEKKRKQSTFKRVKSKNKVLRKDNENEQARRRRNAFLKRILPKKVYLYYLHASLMDVFLLLLLGIALVLTHTFVINGVQKILPIGKTETVAFVSDKNSESEIYYYVGKVSDPYFALDIEFTDENGEEYKIVKEVVKSVYEKHGIGDFIKISYTTRNPYNVFIRDYSLWSFLQTVTYAKFWFRFGILFILIIICAARVSLQRKSKKKH